MLFSKFESFGVLDFFEVVVVDDFLRPRREGLGRSWVVVVGWSLVEDLGGFVLLGNLEEKKMVENLEGVSEL